MKCFGVGTESKQKCNSFLQAHHNMMVSSIIVLPLTL